MANQDEFSKSVRRSMVEVYVSMLGEERVNDEKFIDYMNSMIQAIHEHISSNEPTAVSPEVYAWRVIDGDILLFIINKPSEKFSGRYSPGKNKKDKKLALNVANTPLEKSFAQQDWTDIIDNMRDVLFHELTHYIDFDRMEPHDDYGSPKEKASLEFNAVFNSIVQHFYKKADSIANSKETDKLSMFHSAFGDYPTSFLKNTMDILLKNKVISDEFPTVDQWHWKKRLFDTYRILRNRIFKTIISKESAYRI